MDTPAFVHLTGNEIRLAESVSKQLARGFRSAAGAFVETPLLYPGGSHVVVQLSEPAPGVFLVSDRGYAAMEAELIGAPRRTFRRTAETVARRMGVAFDKQMLFVAEVQEGALTGAVVAVANASKEAADLTAMRMHEDVAEDRKTAVLDRLRSVFGDEAVAADAEITGASGRHWKVDARVQAQNRGLPLPVFGPAVFVIVGPHANSVYRGVAAFGDLAELDGAPTRVAVSTVPLAKREATDVTMIGRVARMIEADASREAYIGAVAA